jgi:copper chaperone CopZ
MQYWRAICVVCCSLIVGALGLAEELPIAKHQVTGLFSKERIPDLQKTILKLPGIELVKVQFATAEAEFRYNAAKVFPNTPPEKITERFDNMLRDASRHTFGIKPLCATPRDKLQLVEIPVLGLDCKACCLAAYEAVYKLEGVEQATASFKDGLVTAWIYPETTDADKLKAALKQRNVTLKETPTP